MTGSPRSALHALLTGALALALVFAFAGVASASAVGGSINGTITNSNAEGLQPLAGICVQLFDAAGDGSTPLQSIQDADNGTYSFTGLDISKDYVVRFYGCQPATQDRVEYWNENSLSFDGATANAIHFDADGQSFQEDAFLYPGGSVTGTVSQQGGGAVDGICVDFELVDRQTIFPDYHAVTSGGGHYTIHGVRPSSFGGPYRVHFVDCRPNGDLIGNYWTGPDTPGSTDFHNAAGINLTAGTTPTADGALAPGATISGHVTGDADAPLENVCVDVYDDNSGYEDFSQKTDVTGFYKYVVPAGTYTVGTYRCQGTPAKYVGSVQTGKAAVAGQTTTVDFQLVQDLTAPTAFITSGPAAGSTTGPSGFFAVDTDDGSNTFCAYDRDPDTTGNTYDDYCYGEVLFPTGPGTLSDGDHTFKVVAVDEVGNASTVVTRTWHVSSSAGPATTTTGTLPANGTAYGPGGFDATASNPLTVRLSDPTAGDVTMTREANSVSAPTGYSLLGSNSELLISAPTAASANNPLSFTFLVDASLLVGKDPSTIEILRDGVAIPRSQVCADPGVASPDPCYGSTFVTGSGDLRLDIVSTHASKWNVAQKTGSTDTGGGGGGGGGDTGGSTGGTPTTSTPAPTPSGTTTPPASTPAATKCVVPKLIGLSLAKAKKALAKAHCGVGKIAKKKAKPKKGKKIKKGTVIAQSPAAGTKKPAGSKVAITLAK